MGMYVLLYDIFLSYNQGFVSASQASQHGASPAVNGAGQQNDNSDDDVELVEDIVQSSPKATETVRPVLSLMTCL